MEMGATIDASNLSQLESWDGATGGFWTENADRFDEGVAGYRSRFLEAAAISENAQVLDVGCGSGQTTRDAARAAPAGAALGVDLSAEMLQLAHRRAQDERLTNAVFEQADAQVHPLSDQHFDVAVSRHGAMFFGDPVQAFTNIGRALRPGGRLVLLTWQPFERQEWLHNFFSALAAGRSVPVPPSDAPSPFALSDPDRVRVSLTAAGFVDIDLEGLSAPMFFGATVHDAMGFVAGQHAGMLDKLSAEKRSDALQALRADLAAHLSEQGVHYESAAWLIQARTP